MEGRARNHGYQGSLNSGNTTINIPFSYTEQESILHSLRPNHNVESLYAGEINAEGGG